VRMPGEIRVHATGATGILALCVWVDSWNFPDLHTLPKADRPLMHGGCRSPRYDNLGTRAIAQRVFS